MFQHFYTTEGALSSLTTFLSHFIHMRQAKSCYWVPKEFLVLKKSLVLVTFDMSPSKWTILHFSSVIIDFLLASVVQEPKMTTFITTWASWNPNNGYFTKGFIPKSLQGSNHSGPFKMSCICQLDRRTTGWAIREKPLHPRAPVWHVLWSADVIHPYFCNILTIKWTSLKLLEAAFSFVRTIISIIIKRNWNKTKLYFMEYIKKLQFKTPLLYN